MLRSVNFETDMRLFDASAPKQELGDYHAWPLDLGFDCPIDLVWVSRASDYDSRPHFVLPHGEPSIAIKRMHNRAGIISDVSLQICGPFTKARWYKPKPGLELIAVRLKPEYSALAYGVFAGDFTDVDLIIDARALKHLFSKTLRIAQTENRKKVAQALVGDLLVSGHPARKRASPEMIAAAKLRNKAGAISIKSLAGEIGVSERHLRRCFRDAMGVSPKTYGRQLRITAAQLAADKTCTPDWAGIATMAGFFDQAHMIADFRSLTGTTPVIAHQRRLNLSAFSNTDSSNDCYDY